MARNNIKTCFVAAPQGVRLDAVRQSLLAHDITLLVPEDLLPGSDWASGVQQQIVKADLVIGILPQGKQSPWVLFELGQASALGRRILLIAPPQSDIVPFSLQRFLVLRIDPSNREAIDFALDQLISAPSEIPRHDVEKKLDLATLGTKADQLNVELSQTLNSGSERAFEAAITEAIRNSGTDIVVEAPQRDRGADLAVWSDVLEPFIGNPLLVEIKLRVRDKKSADAGLKALSSYLDASHTRWGLLLYGEGPPADDKIWRNCPPNILVLPAQELLSALRTRPFPEIVRDLRNRRVHSVRP